MAERPRSKPGRAASQRAAAERAAAERAAGGTNGKCERTPARVAAAAKPTKAEKSATDKATKVTTAAKATRVATNANDAKDAKDAKDANRAKVAESCDSDGVRADWTAETSVSELAGVGPARAAAFARVGIETLAELARFAPVRVREWEAPIALGALIDGVERGALPLGRRLRVAGRLRSNRLRRLGGRRSIVRLRIEEEGRELELNLFNQAWVHRELLLDERVEAVGRIERSGQSVLVRVDALGSSRRPLPPPGALEPLYPSIDGIGAAHLRGWCRAIAEHLAADLTEPLSRDVLREHGLPAWPDALVALHAPSSLAAFEAARRRARLEELLRFQARIARRREGGARERARPADVSPRTLARFERALPFEPTAGQRRVLEDLRRELALERPMRRLLQGDVGSGKTTVALYAALAVAAAGGQVAMLAPTMLLAEQHAAGLAPVLAALGLRAACLTGASTKRQRRALEERVAAGELDLVFGTHALLGDGLAFARLDLAIIDEQHRFGVAHRARLLQKGRGVHLLLMTATPIPRTLALGLYGDLDVSVLDEKPPGRGRLRTRWVRGQKRRKILPFVVERLRAGEQVYWVCPRVGDQEAPEEGAVVSAERRFAKLRDKLPDDLGVALAHGRQAPAVRAAALDSFRRGDVRLLVATTVIEVGVDVPAATVMVIEDAQRLGLAALHQLRGRVGRGPGDAWCLLLGTVAAKKRLELLEECDDGFRLAEEDLRERGMGELLGLRQAGLGEAGAGLDEDDEALAELARALVREDLALRAAYAPPTDDEIVP